MTRLDQHLEKNKVSVMSRRQIERKNTVEYINKNVSSKFLSLNKTYPFYRSSKQWIDSGGFRIIKSFLEDRKPKDVKLEMHNALNRSFKKAFGWNVRNGVFATRSFNAASSLHDNVYYFYPIGSYEYCYSPKIHDLIDDTIVNNLSCLVTDKYTEEQWIGNIDSPYTWRAVKDYFTQVGINTKIFDTPSEYKNLEKMKSVIQEYIDGIVDKYKDSGLETDSNVKSEISFKCKEYILSLWNENGYGYGVSDNSGQDEDDY